MFIFFLLFVAFVSLCVCGVWTLIFNVCPSYLFYSKFCMFVVGFWPWPLLDMYSLCWVADVVNLDLKSTLRVLYNIFTKYKASGSSTTTSVQWTTTRLKSLKSTAITEILLLLFFFNLCQARWTQPYLSLKWICSQGQSKW